MVNDRFFEDYNFGKIAENMFITLMQRSGYRVYRYGVENTFQQLREDIKDYTDPASRKFLTTPDIVIHDIERNVIFLTEIKATRGDKYVTIKTGLLQEYINYWRESLLVFVCPNAPFPHIYYYYVFDFIPRPYDFKEDSRILKPRKSGQEAYNKGDAYFKIYIKDLYPITDLFSIEESNIKHMISLLKKHI